MNYDPNLCYCGQITEQKVVVTLGTGTYRKRPRAFNNFQGMQE